MTQDHPTPPQPDASELVHLQTDGVSVVLDLGRHRLPVVAYWGESLGAVGPAELVDLVRAGLAAYRDSPFDVANRVLVVPEHASAWIGRPGLEGSREGRDWSTAFRVTQTQSGVADDGTHRVTVAAADEVARLEIVLEIELRAGGLLRLRASLTNTDPEVFTVGGLRLALPVPSEATELLDFTGRHTRERIPQRRAFTAGTHAREVRTGRTGLDASYLLTAGSAGFGFRHGEVWGVHLGWSGNQTVYAERLYNGASVLGGGELLEHGELQLGRGQTYQTPWLYGTYGHGLDAVAGQFHRYLRDRTDHPTSPRPVILNTWEAVYYNHDLATLTALADRAHVVGVERFVLDDGWFAGRRDDTSSLGDWTVSSEVWPEGLGPLISHVRSLGMEFGLWVEPEMVSMDSDLARAHPEWVFAAGGRTGLASRQQHVLDLGHQDAYDHVRDDLDALLSSYDIGYLKWDHNRYLNDAGHTPDGVAGIHVHTLAAYRLMAELRARHPGLEIEACSAGGGRIDLGVLDHTDRVWASDCIDPLERQQIQRYTQLLVPPELVGTHIGSPRSHTTLRQHDLPFRAQTAIWGHLGIEWDLNALSADELTQLTDWVALHKSLRGLLHTGTVVNGDHPDQAIWLNGVVAADRTEALYGVTAVRRSTSWPPGRVRLPGLDPRRRYLVQIADLSRTGLDQVELPAWTDHGVTLSGRTLGVAGIELLPIFPEHSYLVRLTSP